jgi:GWxTD domain-containing protein
LPPGDYIIECTVQVENTHLAYRKEAPVNVPNFLESGIGLGKPRMYSARLDTTPRAIVFRPVRGISEFKAVPLEHTNFTEVDRRPAFSFDLYLDKSVEDSVPCTVVYQVTDADKSQLLYGRKRVNLAGLGDQFVVFCSTDDWDPGKYTFAAKAFIYDPPRAGGSTLDFSVEFSPTVLTRRFDETLEILSLIASKDEVKAFRDAAETERSKVWAAFWKRRDPTPETDKNEALDEHLRRVRFVSANFSTADVGWRSDRGKVYIKYGEPDETETRADPYFQGDYLIWRYYPQDLTFVFYDRFGLGEYRLSDASAF